MSLKIIKGQKADITKNTSISRVVVGMGWGASAGVDLDFSVFVLQANGKVRSDNDLIFYSNPTGAGGAIRIVGQEKKSYGSQTDQEQVSIDLRSVPQELERIPFTLTIYEGDARRQNFSLVKDAYLRIIDETTGNELLRYELGNQFPVETAIVVGELYRYNGEWKFNAVGSGYSGGLASLCGSFGIVVREEPPAASPPPVPPAPPKVEPAKPPVGQASPPSSPPPVSPVRLDKIELKKKGDVINLEKKAGSLGEILVNLNWNRKKTGGGFFKAASGIDLDLGCLFELKDGTKGGVQALGNAFGDFQRPPYVALDGDDRTGALEGGENLRINGAKVADIKRIVIFAFIYSGVANWSQADGVVTVKYPGGPDIVVRMDEYGSNKGLCAIAMIRNVNDQTFSVERLVQFFDDQQKLDVAYDWGLRWTRGSK
ncbi:TerD domain-containing protein [Cohnella sp. LGH]|uniref:Tellurite resistance protein TerA n=1 Tax=Cohnella phaseoli TaxID=456490 RepID=A0A3D9INR6_9BACL|nr:MULTISPECIES: TerD family protein [Cohnella]QTH41163.1 TerD domain-containing protein [Cohnella sp. LGH]RED63412.1 tellurite resistance protein TerA [Cohnella phaseoli]